MKQSCPNCHTILEINENEYTPGEIISKECPLCDEKIEFVIPSKEKTPVTTTSPTSAQEQEKTAPKKVVRVKATDTEKQNAEKKIQEKLQRTEAKKRKAESKTNTLAYVVAFLIVILIAGLGYIIYIHNTTASSSDNDDYIVENTIPETVEYQGYMDWEFGITMRLSENGNAVEGVYNNNAYPGTFLDVNGTKSGSNYYLTLYRSNGSEMGKFSLTRAGKSMLGKYYDTKSGTDHRVEISSDVDNPIPYQTDPSKICEVADSCYAFADSCVAENEIYRETNDHSYVDLDLPSGICWATCNLGAYSSADKGDHFAWGETSSKYDYTQSSYHCSLGSRDLTSGYDAASQIWGGTWRIPTKDEWQELMNYCNWSWTGTGYRVTGRNGNSIFLPAAGYSKGSSRFKEGERGDYWTSTPNGSEKSYEFVIKSDDHRIESDSRFYGASIRPVTN